MQTLRLRRLLHLLHSWLLVMRIWIAQDLDAADTRVVVSMQSHLYYKDA